MCLLFHECHKCGVTGRCATGRPRRQLAHAWKQAQGHAKDDKQDDDDGDDEDRQGNRHSFLVEGWISAFACRIVIFAGGHPRSLATHDSSIQIARLNRSPNQRRALTVGGCMLQCGWRGDPTALVVASGSAQTPRRSRCVYSSTTSQTPQAVGSAVRLLEERVAYCGHTPVQSRRSWRTSWRRPARTVRFCHRRCYRYPSHGAQAALARASLQPQALAGNCISIRVKRATDHFRQRLYGERVLPEDAGTVLPRQ